MPKVSVIVPVYKAEKYLHRCVDSIIGQTFTDWELLLIDDGSPDKSGEICEEYAKKDSRVRVFHKENGGVSSARNVGIDNANSEYVTFVDADDWIDDNNLSICISAIETSNLDILQYSFKRIDDNGYVFQVKEINTEVLDLPHYLEKGAFNMCVWGAYIKTSIIQQFGIRFDKNVKLAEDQMFVMEVMSQAQRLQAINLTYYNYYFNPDSATNNEKAVDMIQSSYRCIEFKHRYPLFEYRMDDLVLFFSEKLLLRHCYKDVRNIMTELKPRHYRQRPWPSMCMAYISQYSARIGVFFGGLTYPAYCSFMKLLSTIKSNLSK